MLKTLLLIAFALMASGCLPDGFESSSPSAGVDVTPAKGGGGNIEPAEIPINVKVTVERRGDRIIFNERDEFADDCDCGCGESGCNCSESLKSSTPPVRESGSACQTWISGGNLYWMADGVQWYLETGGTLSEGQTVQGGRFVMRNGQVVDTSGGRVESVDTKPQYIKQCDDTGCRLIRVN